MRSADRADRFEARVIVEKAAAPASDLHINETRQQELSFKIDARGAVAARIRGKRDGLDAAIGEQNGVSVHDSLAGQDPAVRQCGAHYTVSVILCKCGGRSGSRPRLTASEAIMR